ncbi:MULTISPECIES: hypothetical protein [unclassified Mesorhizobium]|uniref:hypothetical protein n=1 Tax=unclassified Mesorhizobium TaxID=325217 RepID=UPI000F75C322|nr:MULTISPECIES: hypothetical protein [unclassified Mesorhizobium]AZO75348.1 hypothetical protein EJ067_32360 [Mesorhizobium sp. M1D.F.Ca.ET.043.01.1.1]RWA87678.1 MAG: hypothetical protein EOQ32_24030 [Mesorhizobium sp.]
MKVALSAALILLYTASSASADCRIHDKSCHKFGNKIEKSKKFGKKKRQHRRHHHSRQWQSTSGPGFPAEIILHPVRQYLREEDIPPLGVGAYGVVALKSKPTDANRNKLMMVCKSYLAHFDKAEFSPHPRSDQMVTVWPLNHPESPIAESDDCSWILGDYALGAASTAMAFATKQHMTFEGEGPFLLGWSPASSRFEPDELVLMVDMSASNNQASIDHDFDFWKDEIVRDPATWRHGFSLERIRQKIKDFVDLYGADFVEDIKMVGL